VNNTVVLIRNVYGSADVQKPYTVVGKQQRDPKTGALMYLNISTVTVEFDSFSNYEWGFGNGVTNASSNLLNNCWGAVSTKDAWWGKRYHISGCTAEVRAKGAVHVRYMTSWCCLWCPVVAHPLTTQSSCLTSMFLLQEIAPLPPNPVSHIGQQTLTCIDNLVCLAVCHRYR
jgi:hypothetical protein